MSPALPIPPVNILLSTPVNLLLAPLSKLTVSLASMLIFPASPCPTTLVVSREPSFKDSFPVVTWIFPPLPTAFVNTRLEARLTPSKLTVSRASIVILPASPFPDVLLKREAPLVNERVPVVIRISPALPTAPDSTFAIALPSKSMRSRALMIIFPPFPCPATPVFSLPPFCTVREPALMVISPPLPTDPGSVLL